MSVASIQSLIQKYGPNFGLTPPKADAKPDSTGSTSGSASNSTSGSTSTSDSKPSELDAAALGILKTSAKLPNGDTVSLSPEAMDYLAAHTGALGKFEVPNMMGYFFDAADGVQESNDSINSLAKLLGQHGAVPGASDFAGDPFSSLSGFL